jgi:hypothetical protein
LRRRRRWSATDYNGSLSSTDLIAHLDHSAAAELVAAMPANAFGQTDADTRVDLYEDAFLAFDQSISHELAKQIARG